MRRERQKEKRRQQIIDAAEALVRETRSTDFTVDRLARRAQLSVTTIYNLMNSKSSVLYALLVSSIDRLARDSWVDTDGKDPVSIAIAATEATTKVFTDDPDFLKPLYRYLLGIITPEHRNVFTSRSLHYWISHLKPLETQSLLPRGVELVEFAREYQVHFSGALDHWVQNELNDEEFQAQIRYSGLLRLLSLGIPAFQQKLTDDLIQTAPLVRRAALACLLHGR